MNVAIPSEIVVKYIIVKDYNDNKEEITKFFDKMSSIKILAINFDIDYNDIIKYEAFTIPHYYYDLIEYAKNLATEKQMSFGIPPYTEMVLERGYSLPKIR